MYYEIIKRYYDSRLYTKENVASFVKAGKLSSEDYEKITGEAYLE